MELWLEGVRRRGQPYLQTTFTLEVALLTRRAADIVMHSLRVVPISDHVHEEWIL